MKKFWGIFLIVIFVPLLFLSLVGLAFRQTFYKPEFVKSEIKKLGTYEKIHQNIPQITVEIIKKQTQESPELTLPFTTAETTKLAQKILSSCNIQKISEAAIDGLWPWLFGLPEVSPEKTSISDIKQKGESEIYAALKEKYQLLPICQKYQQFSGDFSDPNTCRPKNVSFEDLMKEYENQTGIKMSFLSGLPDNLHLDELAKIDPNFQNIYVKVHPFQSVLAASRYLVYVLPLIFILIIFLAIKLIVPDWEKVFYYFGAFLVSLSVLFALFGLWFFALFGKNINVLVQKIPYSQELISVIIIPITERFVFLLSQKFYQLLLILLGLAIFVILLKYSFDYFNKKQLQKAGWSLKKQKRS